MPDSLRIVKKFFPKVASVKQATRKVRIEVTADDSVIGRGKAHHACAMARACKRALHLDGAIVSLGSAYLVKGDRATRYQVPQAVSREIVSFDRGGGFAPGVYALYRPTAAARGTKKPPGEPHSLGEEAAVPHDVQRARGPQRMIPAVVLYALLGLLYTIILTLGSVFVGAYLSGDEKETP